MTTRLGIFLLISLLTLLVVFPSIPLFGNLPLSDSAIYIYTAKEILQGKMLYVDLLFDTKPPGIFLINILGLLLSNNSYWGIWILQFLFISQAAWLGFLLIKKQFDTFPAMTATGILLLSLVFLYEHGNSTEFYGIFFQFLALYLFTKTQAKGNHLWKFFFIGCCSAGLFLLRANLIGIQLAIFIFVLYHLLKNKHQNKYFFQILAMLGGIFFSLLPWILYFYFNNALKGTISMAILANIYYSASPVINKVASAIIGIFYLLSTTGITLYAFLGLLFVGIAFLKKDKPIFNNKLLLIALIDLPLEIAFSSVSGRNYPHYYAPWLPSLAILTAFFLRNLIAVSNKSKYFIYPVASIIFMFALLRSYNTFIYNSWLSRQYASVGKMINKTTKNNDTILVWGIATTIYLAADRKTTGKYIYHNILFLRNYTTNVLIQGFYNDLLQKPPKYIVDITKLRDTIPSLDKERRKQWIPLFTAYEDFKELKTIYSLIEKNYYLSDTLPTGWRIYKLKE